MVHLEGARDAIAAVAVSPDNRIAVGDSRGVLVGRESGALRRHWLRGAVRQVKFLAGDGKTTPPLWVATEAGLYRAGSESGGRPIAPAPGARAATVSRIATAAGVTGLATNDGVFLSLDGQTWQRLGGAVPTGSASSLALRERSDRIECWVLVRGQLWRVAFRVPARLPLASETRQSDSQVTALDQTLLYQTSANPVELPFAPGDRAGVDIALDIDGAEIVVVYESAIVASRVDAGAKSGIRWEVLRPDLPAGASIVELVQAIGWCWLATDRGLFRARTLRGPWHLTNGPLASRPIRDLAASGGQRSVDAALYAATDRGLMVGRLGTSSGAPSPLKYPSQDPSIDRVHRAAVDYLELNAGRMRAIHRGLDLRGWLPIVGFSVTRDRDRSRGSDFDEAYVSGGLRELRDSDSDRSTELELRLSFSWDLRDIAYHPERLDISREAREIIELRDEVLDEVTQLYFERQRLLGEIRAKGGDLESLPLQIRAEQLAAGIDAWTGGWFSRRVDPFTPSTDRDPVVREPRRRRLTRGSGQATSPVPNPSENNSQ